ncbi:MAG: polysaccharide biosynthesis/export family protein [Thermodesulfobacteriota bacterium]
MKRLLFFFLAITLGWPAAFGVLPAHGQQDYRVGESDVLKISVYDHDDLKTTAQVSRDGYITFPLLGKVQVVGLTLGEVEQKLATLLAAGYVVNPQVQILVEGFRGRVVYVTGEVKKADAYKYEDDMTLIRAITVAGGFTPIAAKGRVKVVRKDASGREVTIERAPFDERILPDDIIIVPESFF